MWWVPLASAGVLGLFIAILHHWHQRRQVDSARIYRARFVQLVAQLDTITRSVNSVAPVLTKIKDAKVLDYYESTLKILETLLAAVQRIPPFGTDPGGLDSAFFLVRDCRQRVGRVQYGFQESLRGRDVKLDQLYGRPEESPSGCYFCSRPVIADRFSKVRVRIDSKVKEVMSCKICRDELEQTKKVKVLYFMKDGHPVHWSDVKDYFPSEDYWNINKRDFVRKTQHLELVYSQTERPLGDA